MSKPKYDKGQSAQARHSVIGTEVGAGTPLEIVDSRWNEREQEWLYLARTPGRFLVSVFESSMKGTR